MLRALASMITYYVTGRPTSTSINLGMHLHGLTRSKELVDIFHRVGVCIGYSSVLVLRDAWAVHDLQFSLIVLMKLLRASLVSLLLTMMILKMTH